MTLNIITVTLNLGINIYLLEFFRKFYNKFFILLDTVNFLGISIVGQSDKKGESDGGIYVGSIMKG
jgi:hypothetical protein